MKCDVLVVGGGHAGIEAAAAAARYGFDTILMTMSAETIGQMSCNPAIGGTAKGHVVREIDAFGGVMAKLIDRTGIQYKMLNRSKGPAMWSPRAQADRAEYSRAARQLMEEHPRIRVIEDTAAQLVVEGRRATGIVGTSGQEYEARAVIISSGTFLSGLLHVGMESFIGGRMDEPSAETLSGSLAEAGLEIGRLKTGTPPRVDGTTIDYSLMERQDGDDPPPFFSYTAEHRDLTQIPCWLTRTLPETHDILRSGLDRSPLFTGKIQGVGPRYCPSIEDKIVRFPDRPRHQIFIEPEGLGTNQVYVNGFATSLPMDIQEKALHSIPGMADAKILRWGYAVEYDFVYPQQLYPSLETKAVAGLYLAGQINGTSGYEEAAGQGLMTGINAARALRGEDPVVLGRDQAYIGVMIDDLVTKGTQEPYRLFTSRAEHRLLLRQDNADIRLAEIAYRAGAISESTYAERMEKRCRISVLVNLLDDIRISPDEANPVLKAHETSAIAQTHSASQLLKRPQIDLADLEHMSDAVVSGLNGCGDDVRWQVETEVKYSGYLKRQNAAVARQKDLEDKVLEIDFPYLDVKEISTEARQKLAEVRPRTLGQALRIPGVRSADVAALRIAIEKYRRSGKSRKEQRDAVDA